MPNTKDLIGSIFPIKVVLYGPSGSGKTLLASTFPKPYFLDLDNGMRTLQGLDVEYESIFQDPTKKGQGYTQVLKRIVELVDKELLDDSRTLVLDSLTNLNDMAVEYAETVPTGRDQRQMWGVVLEKTVFIMKKLRAAKCNVVVTCQEEYKEDLMTQSLIYSPSLFGKSSIRVPYLFDEVYRLYVDATGKHVIQTDLDLRTHCKSRLNRLKLLEKKIQWEWNESDPHSNPIFERLKKAEEVLKSKNTTKI